jgi:hypothetical protein
MAYVGNSQRPQGVNAKMRRIEKLPNYPVNSMIVWKFGGDNPEEVIRHDTEFGRLITRAGGNYDPFEVEPYIEK